MAEEITNSLSAKRVATTYRGLLHFPQSIPATLAKQTVYDGTGTPTSLLLGGGNIGAEINGNFLVGNNITVTGETNLNNNLYIKGNISLLNIESRINDILIYPNRTEVSMKILSGFEVGNLRIAGTTNDYELKFGNPFADDKNLFSIIVKKDSGNNLFIKNKYDDSDLNSPFWINRSTGEVSIKTLRVNSIKSETSYNALPAGQPPNSKRNEVPIGCIVMFPDLTIPGGWFECDGASYSKTTYPELFKIIGYTYGGSDDKFQVPDLRGLFVRGYDHRRSDETDHTLIDPQVGRTLGSKQDDIFKSHKHNMTGGGGTDIGLANVDFTSSGTASLFTDSVGGDETRPKNISLVYCIKW